MNFVTERSDFEFEEWFDNEMSAELGMSPTGSKVRELLDNIETAARSKYVLSEKDRSIVSVIEKSDLHDYRVELINDNLIIAKVSGGVISCLYYMTESGKKPIEIDPRSYEVIQGWYIKQESKNPSQKKIPHRRPFSLYS